MTGRNIAIAAFAALYLLGCAANHRVRRINQADIDAARRFDKHMLFYALPRTIIQVSAEVAMSELVPGKCANESEIAKRLLDLEAKDLLRRPTTQFTLGAVKTQAFADVDPDNVFAVEIEPALFQRRSQTIELSDKGLLESGMSDASSQVTELAVKTLEVGAGLAGKAITMGAGAGGAGLSQCEQIAVDIKDRRDKQLSLVGGTASVAFSSKDTLELMLSNLRAQEARLLGEFTGVPKRTVLATVRCDVIPASKYHNDSSPAQNFADLDERHLLTVSKDRGILHADAGCMVPGALERRVAPGHDEKRVHIAIDSVGAALPDVVASVQRRTRREDGLFYRIPGIGRVSTRVDREFRDSRDRSPRLERGVGEDQMIQIAQFGVVGTLPASTMKAYSAKYDAKFYSSIGALKRLDTSATSVDTAALGAVNPAVQGLGQAFVDRAKADAGAEDPLALLIRRRTMIEERERIQCLKENRFPECGD